MAYDEQLADQVRESLVDHFHLDEVEEKEMMGGLAFMVNHKMCVGIIKEDLMACIDPEIYEEALEKHGCRPMDFTGKPMKGWVFISPEGINSMKDLKYWIGLALDFNVKAKQSKKQNPKP